MSDHHDYDALAAVLIAVDDVTPTAPGFPRVVPDQGGHSATRHGRQLRPMVALAGSLALVLLVVGGVAVLFSGGGAQSPLGTETPSTTVSTMDSSVSVADVAFEVTLVPDGFTGSQIDVTNVRPPVPGGTSQLLQKWEYTRGSDSDDASWGSIEVRVMSGRFVAAEWLAAYQDTSDEETSQRTYQYRATNAAGTNNALIEIPITDPTAGMVLRIGIADHQIMLTTSGRVSEEELRFIADGIKQRPGAVTATTTTAITATEPTLPDAASEPLLPFVESIPSPEGFERVWFEAESLGGIVETDQGPVDTGEALSVLTIEYRDESDTKVSLHHTVGGSWDSSIVSGRAEVMIGGSHRGVLTEGPDSLMLAWPIADDAIFQITSRGTFSAEQAIAFAEAVTSALDGVAPWSPDN